MSEAFFYPANTNPLGYLRAHFPGLPHVLGDLTPSGLPLLYPWEDLRHQYPEIIGDAAQPTAEQVAAWVPEVVPPEDPAPVTDVEILFSRRVQPKLNSDEEKRTGKAVNPNGAVPLARSFAATAITYNGWHYPSPEDLETPENQYILSKIYEDPTTNTTAESSTEQKQKVLHFTLVMLAGQAFGVDYQAELGAYERTASGDFQAKLKDDNRDWLLLPCPKMHRDWPEFETIKAMFQAVMR